MKWILIFGLMMFEQSPLVKVYYVSFYSHPNKGLDPIDVIERGTLIELNNKESESLIHWPEKLKYSNEITDMISIFPDCRVVCIIPHKSKFDTIALALDNKMIINKKVYKVDKSFGKELASFLPRSEEKAYIRSLDEKDSE